jgi:pimeloyl-ACP methyl ester carboxylesterase
MKLRTIDVGGLVHYADFGGRGPRTLVLVHGLGGSLYNWASSAPMLTHLGRVVALDLAGFGRSPWRRGNARITANRALLGRFLRAITPGPVVLVGNSMGGMLSMLQASHEPASVEALILACPALLPAPPGSHEREVTAFFALGALPVVGEALARRQRQRVAPDEAVEQMMDLCGVPRGTVDPQVFRWHADIARERLEMPWAIPAFCEASRSLLGNLLLRRRQVEAAMRRVQAPTLLMQGMTDRLVLPSMSRQAHRVCPSWSLDELPAIGHTPMLQDPTGFAARVSSWLTAR